MGMHTLWAMEGMEKCVDSQKKECIKQREQKTGTEGAYILESSL